MAKKNELAVVKETDYAILEQSTDELSEIIEENVGEQIQVSDLDKTGIPAGGATSFEVPTLDGEEDVKTIEGIIVGFKDGRAFWKESFDETGGGTPPDCFSDDMVTGVGDPGGACATCPFNQFGSAENGDGKACKEMRTVFVLREGDLLPLAITLPATSIKPMKQYFLRLVNFRKRFYHVVTKFELEKTQNKGGIKYSKVKPSVSKQISDEGQKEKLKNYVDTMAPLLKNVSAGDIATTEQQREAETAGAPFEED
jgi:hypothetical protein